MNMAQIDEIKYIKPGDRLQEHEIQKDLVKEDCRKCYGRGHVGRDVESGLLIPCKCLLRNSLLKALQNAAKRIEDEKTNTTQPQSDIQSVDSEGAVGRPVCVG